MIKARLGGTTKPTALLGISGENITRLLADEPILVHLADIGMADIDIVIVAGKTELDILAALERVGLLTDLS